MNNKPNPLGNNPVTKISAKPWKPMSLKEVLGSKKDLEKAIGTSSKEK